ncbi:MAG: lipase maturation factor family protein, partial [Terriglobia bacterium]
MNVFVRRLLRFSRWALDGERPDQPGHLWPRWIFLRALGLIFASAFYSLLFQINGLVGPQGILPADRYLKALSQHFGASRYWYAPTLLWIGNGSGALHVLCWAGLIASVLLFLNLWPRASVAVCVVTYLSFVAAAQDFSSYQSDGMLLAAGFLTLFFAPPGLLPGLGERHPPSRASLFLLLWLWFRIYFESGVAKIAGGDPEWRHLTALYDYYSNGPLPNWIGWYAQHLPHGFNAAVALITLLIELGLVWLLFFPRRFRIACFFIVTPFQLGIIVTANLAFLNHLVLSLGFLLLDDRFLRFVFVRRRPATQAAQPRHGVPGFLARWWTSPQNHEPAPAPSRGAPAPGGAIARAFRPISRVITGVLLGWVFYDTLALLLLMLFPLLPLPRSPIEALEPYRLANQYGLFAVMTRARYEIEFQGSRDGKAWIAYPFRYKPQDPARRPGFYAPYQPRFDWNLWFATLGTWQQYPFVVRTEALLLLNDSSVLSLFAGNPFDGSPPSEVRAVMWRYWFASLATKRTTGLWWRRKLVGLYAPALER